jgi:hypothetical protein
MKRSFMTSLPDKSGAFLQASRILLAHGGNMVRASYNKAVDAHMLFLDVEGEADALDAIEAELNAAGFLPNDSQVKVVLLEVELPDHPGAVIPVLETLSARDVSISYLSNQSSGNATAALNQRKHITLHDFHRFFHITENAVDLCRFLFTGSIDQVFRLNPNKTIHLIDAQPTNENSNCQHSGYDSY